MAIEIIKYPKEKSNKSCIIPVHWKLNIERNRRFECKGEIYHGQGEQDSVVLSG